MVQTGEPRKALTNTGRVLLGMIAEGHGTGYAIKAEIERSTRLYWGASIGGIYPELRRLQADGLVSSRENFRGGARRHAYELTPAGRELLREWLTDPGEPLLEMRHEALLRLRFAGVLPFEEQQQVVRRMRRVHERRIAELERRLQAERFDDPLHRATIEFGVGWNSWARDWCDELDRTIAARRGSRRAGRRS
jgi:DNA-binding PadR family transcriptional regulator